MNLEHATQFAVEGLSRRRVLQAIAVLAGGTLGTAGCGRSTPPWLQPPANQTLTALSPRSYATLTAACARIAGPRVAQAITSQRLHPGLVADEWLGRTPGAPDPINQALTLLEFGIYPLVAKWRPFTQLDDAAQDAALRNLQQARLGMKRAVFGGIRSVALLAVYLSPDVGTLIPYPAPFGTDAISLADAMAPLPPA
jgi:hypothetical protein